MFKDLEDLSRRPSWLLCESSSFDAELPDSFAFHDDIAASNQRRLRRSGENRREFSGIKNTVKNDIRLKRNLDINVDAYFCGPIN